VTVLAVACQKAPIKAVSKPHRSSPRSPLEASSIPPRPPSKLLSVLIRDEIQFKLLQILQDEPQLNQRALAKRMGVSLGMTNYCLNALIDKGLIKARNFLESGQKKRYLYQVTPQGIANKAQITRDFLARKRAEYLAIQAEIHALEASLRETAFQETALQETGTGVLAEKQKRADQENRSKKP